MDVEFELLSLLSEDVYGLWEIEVQVPGERDALRGALVDLLDGGLISWFTREGDAGEVQPWAEGDAPPELDSDSAWACVTGGAPHLLSATAKGVTEYFRRAR